MPAGIFNIVQGTGVTGDALARHPGIGKISFTGSTRTGAAIMKAAAESGIKPVTLELGGKSPQLVFADADLEKAATCIASSILANSGQGCVAGSRVIVQRPIAEALIDLLKVKLPRITPGHTWKAATDFGPIVSEAQARRIDRIVTASREQGGEVLIGGGLMAGYGGAYYQPTIIANVTGDNAAVREEIFGPVLTIQSFADEDEGFALADHPEYGLAAGVYTRDLGRGLRAVRRLQAGTVWVNRYSRTLDFILPTGGYKSSGIGKDLGRQAVEQNLRHKTVLIDIAS
jgi:aldehyde dehydrogenase (NAD+)